MQDLYRNLDRRNRSIPKRVFGIMIIAFSVSWIVIQYTRDNIIFLDAIYVVLFLLSGIIQLYESFGRNLLGKTFINLTTEKLDIRITPYMKRLTLQWKDIRDIRIGIVNVELTDNENKTYSIDLSYLDYHLVIELKQRLAELSEIMGQKI